MLDRIAAAVAAGTWTGHGARGTARGRLSARRSGDAGPGASRGARGRTHRRCEIPGCICWRSNSPSSAFARVALLDLGTPADRGPLLAALAATATQDRRAAGLRNPRRRLPARWRCSITSCTKRRSEGPGAGRRTASRRAPRKVCAPALQTAVATALAIAAGDLVSPNRWYWAAFAAFVMFQGTRSRGESLVKGAQFVIGTLARCRLRRTGRPPLLSGHEILTMAAIVAAVFLAFQANVAAYGTMVFWLTVILGLMFGMLGFFRARTAAAAPQGDRRGCRVRRGGGVPGAACDESGRRSRTPLAPSFRRSAVRWTVPRMRCSTARHRQISPTCILVAEQRFRDLSAIAQAERMGLTARATRRCAAACWCWRGANCGRANSGRSALQSARLQDPGLVRLVGETVARIDGR